MAGFFWEAKGWAAGINISQNSRRNKKAKKDRITEDIDVSTNALWCRKKTLLLTTLDHIAPPPLFFAKREGEFRSWIENLLFFPRHGRRRKIMRPEEGEK